MTDNEKLPTTEQMREWCADDGGLAEYHDPINGHRQREQTLKIFDRWLTAELEAARVAGATQMRETAAQAAANAFLTHDMPTPETGPFTIQQRAADEARQQIGAAIRSIPVTPEGNNK